MLLNKLQERIVDISFRKKLSHLGSCLTSVNIIDHIYLIKKIKDSFVLDNGHAALALYVVLEKFHFVDAEELFKKHGVHPNRDPKNFIDVSTGSLGQGIPIAVGMALADRENLVYVLTSDGAMSEGSNWEALRIAGEQRLENLRITVNANGWGAYSKIDGDLLDTRLQMFYPSLVVKTDMLKYPSWLQGLEGHYHVMTEDEHKEITTVV